MALGTESTADRSERIHSSPISCSSLRGFGSYQSAGSSSMSTCVTSDSSNVQDAITKELSNSGGSAFASASRTASEAVADVYTTQYRLEFQRPPYARAPSPSNISAAN